MCFKHTCHSLQIQALCLVADVILTMIGGVNRGQEESPKRLLEPGGKLVVDCGIGQSCGRC